MDAYMVRIRSRMTQLSGTLPVRRRRELGAYSLARRHAGSDQPRVLIFAQGRTGSTLLESLLASTGQFISYGELLGHSNPDLRHPIRYIEGHARFRGESRLHLPCEDQSPDGA